MTSKKRALIISCFDTWYYNRIEPITEILEEEGFRIKVVVSDYHHVKKEYIHEKAPQCTYIHVPSYKKNISMKRIISHIRFGSGISSFLQGYRPDLIYCLLPPNNTAIYCNRYKKENPSCIYIVDVIDLWPESMPIGKLNKTLPAKLWREMRNASLRNADHVFTECRMYYKALKHIVMPTKTSELYLYKEQTTEEMKLVKKYINKGNSIARKAIRYAYLGSINSIIDVDGICGVLREMHSNGYSSEVEVIGSGESKDYFISRLKETGAIVNYHGAVYDEIEKINILASCDFAFNMMKDALEVGLTIKSIDYISYGIPLINSIKGDTWAMVEKYGIGINIDGNPVRVKEIDHRKVYEIYEKYFTREKFVDNLSRALEMIEYQAGR